MCVFWCACVRVGRCVSVVIAIVKRPVLPLYVEDGRCTNLSYYFFLLILFLRMLGRRRTVAFSGTRTLLGRKVERLNCWTVEGD